MDLLAAGYGSDSGSDDSGAVTGKGNVVPKPEAVTSKHKQTTEYSEDDTGESSDASSVDSAELRAAEAAARLRDFGEATTSGRQPGGPGRQQQPVAKSLLPSALDVLDKVEGPPTYLDPEAIRPLATSALHGLSDEQLARLAGPADGEGGGRGVRQKPGKDFDISRLAPPLKGHAKQSADKRDAPPGAVIEGRAKRYKPEEGPEATQQYTAAQIAMMGGNVDKHAGGRTAPMEVSEFLIKGHGAAQLPRRDQDRKDKEKSKRMKGQSTHSHWKSEAEMVLRQQFDS